MRAPLPIALAAASLVTMTPIAARAWLFHEHTSIGRRAVGMLQSRVQVGLSADTGKLAKSVGAYARLALQGRVYP